MQIDYVFIQPIQHVYKDTHVKETAICSALHSQAADVGNKHAHPRRENPDADELH